MSNLVDPDIAFFVVIRITPFAPLEPYIAVASASFKTSMLSISLGFIVLNGLNGAPAADGRGEKLEIKGTPSTMYNGSLPLWMLFCPLNFTVVFNPGVPDVWDIYKPATLPSNPCKT